jgi:hypothetical protein
VANNKGMVAKHRGGWRGRKMVAKSGWRVANKERDGG